MYILKCKCGYTFKRQGTYDPETNATEITDKEGASCPACQGDDVTIIDEESDDDGFQ